jgi:hypothetical protein
MAAGHPDLHSTQELWAERVRVLPSYQVNTAMRTVGHPS